jgi:hypothetical protein
MTNQFHIDFNIPKENIGLDYQSSILTMGSCFSEEIGEQLINAGFDVMVNPYGTLFHPLSIINALSFALGERNVHPIKKGDVYLDFGFSGKIYGMSEEELSNRLNVIGDQVAHKLKHATHLFLTFGTAVGYELASKFFVANCHQQPATLFTKVMSTLRDMNLSMETILDKLYELNPKLKLVLTVSPVRHLKEGVILNCRSKALLIALCDQLETRGIHYFPAYEIFMDELRDYRFSKADFSHPNEIAVRYIWERFKQTYLNDEIYSVCAEVESYHRSLLHKFFYPESKEVTHFIEKLKSTHENLISRIPNLRLKNPTH